MSETAERLAAREPSAKYLAQVEPPLVRGFELLSAAQGGVSRLRGLIRALAVRGNLARQEPSDDPATTLASTIRATKGRLVAEGKLRPDKTSETVSAADRPFSIPASWAWVRFGCISINRDGERIPVSSEDRQQRAKVFDYYGASGVIDKIDGYLFDKTLLLIGEDGANLINRSTPIAFLASGRYWVNNHAHVVDTTHATLTAYLCLFINATSLEPYITGTAQPKMNQAKLNSIPVALPPLAEQHRIVARVEELMKLCDALEQRGRLANEQHARLTSTLFDALAASESAHALAENWQRVAENFDLLLDRVEAIDALERAAEILAIRGLLVAQHHRDEPASAVLQTLAALTADSVKIPKPLRALELEELSFELRPGWAWAQAKDLCRPPNVITYGILKPVWVDVGVPTVRVQDMRNGAIVVHAIGQCSPDRAAKFGKTKLETGDLLIAKDGATLGKTAVVPASLAGGNITQHVLRFPMTPLVDHDFVRLVIDSPHGQAWMKAETKGVALPGVNVGDFRRMPIPLPPFAEQQRIVARVEELLRLCADLRQRLTQARQTQSRLADALVAEVA